MLNTYAVDFSASLHLWDGGRKVHVHVYMFWGAVVHWFFQKWVSMRDVRKMNPS